MKLVLFAGINLSIKVLQAGAWPLGPTQVTIPFAVPQEFEKSIRMVRIHIRHSAPIPLSQLQTISSSIAVWEFLSREFQRAKADVVAPPVPRWIETDVPEEAVHHNDANLSNGDIITIRRCRCHDQQRDSGMRDLLLSLSHESRVPWHDSRWTIENETSNLNRIRSNWTMKRIRSTFKVYSRQNCCCAVRSNWTTLRKFAWI